MSSVKRIVLDVLKPQRPNALEFAQAIANLQGDYRVRLTVSAVDEKTESIVVEIEGTDIQFEAIGECIATMGGSIHSIDEVDVASEPIAMNP